MLNRLFVVDSVTLTSTGTAVSTYTPWDQTTRKLPTQVVVKATGQGAYVRLSNDASAATNADVLVQGGDHVVLSVQGRRWVSVLSDGASSTVNVGALSTGVSGSAASLDLVFVDAGVLDPRVTFTRASTGTFFNSAGVLTSASNNVARFDYNPATLAAQGLLIEEQRTNVLTFSEQFDNAASWAATGAGGTVTANQAVAPDGNTTADQLTFTANAVSGVRQNVTLTAVSHTLSCWMRSISGTAAARLKYFNGTTDTFSSDFTLTTTWQRFSFTFTGVAVAGNISINNGTAGTIQDIYIWGAQLEAGAFPTSYIPTTTTALTRSADVASVNTLSPWFNSTEGTLFAEVSSAAPTVGGVSRRIANINNGTENNRITVAWAGATSVGAAFVSDGGVTQAGFNSPLGAYPFPTKVALAYKTDDFQAAVNGSAFAADTSGTVPTVTQMRIGDVVTGGTGPQNLNGHVTRILYYPRRLSQAELQAITA